MFIPTVAVIKMSHGSFFVFSSDDSKKLVTVWKKYLSTPERCYWGLSENDIINRLWNYCSWEIDGRNIKITSESAKKYINKGWQLANGSSEPKKPFLKEPNKIVQKNLNVLPKLYWLFAVISRKYKSWAIFDILMTITSKVNFKLEKWPHFFVLSFELYPFLIFIPWTI